MATAPFTAAFEAGLKEAEQGGLLSISSDFVSNPRFFCCKSGTTVDVDKDPVALLKLITGRRVCTCATVTVDYSDSWSPSSTINAVEVNWGDGNTSNPAWPGAGTVSHPGGGPGCGGYLWPGTYTITLTVTDLLGATGIDTVQIEVVNCMTWATIEMFCSVNNPGNAGIWYSNDAGGNWADRAGEILRGVPVYDLKINRFTIPYMPYSTIDNTENVELWACTENGLYVARDGARTGVSWKEVDSFDPLLEVTAVQPSKFDPLEVFVLANNQANNEVYLCRTTDSGETWEYEEILPVFPSVSVQAQTYGLTHTLDMSVDGYYVYLTVMDDNMFLCCYRVVYDLSAQDAVYQGWAEAGWGGVRCDYNEPQTVWLFGSIDGGSAVFYSDDDGDNWDDRTPGGWGAHEDQIRPVLMSLYDPNHIIAINNNPVSLETAISGDRGETWEYSTLNHAFVNHCAERGWWDDYFIFEGARTVPVTDEHLQLSINLGVSMWTERAGGIDLDGEVTSIQIMYEHGRL